MLPHAADNRATDSIIVLTGSEGRIERGLMLLRQHRAHRMLISGVAVDIGPHTFAKTYHIPAKLSACCIDLGHRATDTHSNALETMQWLRDHDYKSVRIVTSNWHMPRAKLEFTAILPKNIIQIYDATSADISFIGLFIEYNKYITRNLQYYLRIYR